MTTSERIVCGLVLLKDYITHTYSKDGNLCVDVCSELDDEIHYMLIKAGWIYYREWGDNPKNMYSYIL